MATEPLHAFRDYLLRQVPVPLWLRVQDRAKNEGQTVRIVIVKLLSQYASGASVQDRDNLKSSNGH